MPGNLAASVVSPSSTVLPQALYTSFVRTGVYPILSTSYHDGTLERSLITDGINAPRQARTWVLARRLTTAQLTTLLTFWETTVLGGLIPFYFYDAFDATPIGSNYDPTGVSTTGRATVYFRGNWSQSIEIGRSVVPKLELVEVA